MYVNKATFSYPTQLLTVGNIKGLEEINLFYTYIYLKIQLEKYWL